MSAAKIFSWLGSYVHFLLINFFQDNFGLNYSHYSNILHVLLRTVKMNDNQWNHDSSSIIQPLRPLLLNRNDTVDVLPSIKYLPPVEVYTPLVLIHPLKLTKRIRRKIRIRSVSQSSKLTDYALSDEDDDDSKEEMDMSKSFMSSLSTQIAWLSTKFGFDDSRDQESAFTNIEDTIRSRSAKSNLGGDSVKAKRFISQSRMSRMETRKALVLSKEDTATDVEPSLEDEDRMLTLLNAEGRRNDKQAKLLQGRIDRRKQLKSGGNNNGSLPYIDVVKLNAGPPLEAIPAGYTMYNSVFGPHLIDPSFLTYKRIMYLFESRGSTAKADGWYIGVVIGKSQRPGNNFRVKFDRAVTGTYLVDGVHYFLLSLAGEQAYGRRWVVLDGSPPTTL